MTWGTSPLGSHTSWLVIDPSMSMSAQLWFPGHASGANRVGAPMQQRGVADERDDALLLSLVADGDRGALQELHARHAGWLILRLRRRCRDEQLVEEALQDTFVTVWRKADGFEGRGDPGAWLWGIAVRQLLSKMRPRHNLLERLRPDRPSVSAEEAVLVGLEHGELGRALDGLSPELRAVLQLTVLDGLTTAEAGRLLGTPTGTVKTRAQRARIQMREALA